MIGFFCARIISGILVVLIFCQLLGAQPENSDFADYLMWQADYFRAISEYKRVLYHSRDDSLKNRCLLQISKSYRKSGKYDSALRYSASLLENAKITPELRRQANLNLGLTYLEQKMPALTQQYLHTASAGDSSGFPLMCLGLVQLEMRQWQQASNLFKKAAVMQKDLDAQGELLRLSSNAEDFPSQPHKIPILASTFSLILPGSGQIYSGHVYDGLQAFLFTSSFALATVALYQYENSFRPHLEWTFAMASVAGVFHAANVIGAYRTARYRNWKKQIDFTDQVEETIMRYEPK